MAENPQRMPKEQVTQSHESQTLTRTMVSLLESEQLISTSMYQSKYFFTSLANNV